LVERALILSKGERLDGSELLAPPGPTSGAAGETARAAADAASYASPQPVGDSRATLDDVERAHIRAVLERTLWKIEGGFGAARILRLTPSTLRGRMRKLDIRRSG